MNRFRLAVFMVLAFSAVVVCNTCALAQPGVAPPEPVGKSHLAKTLTPEQRTKIIGMLKDTQGEVLQVLTPEQVQQMEKLTAAPKGGNEVDQINTVLKSLKLSDEQQAKIKAIQDEANTKAAAAKADANLQGKPLQEKIKEIRKAERAQLLLVLTREQRKQFSELMKQNANKNKGEKDQLVLTAEQQAKINAINTELQNKQKAIQADPKLTKAEKKAQSTAARQAADKQIADLLTPEQLEQWKKRQTKAVVKGFWEALNSLTLTAEQKDKIKTINEKTVAAIRQVLTAEQQARFDQMVKNKREQPFLELEEQLKKPGRAQQNDAKGGNKAVK